MSNSVVSTCGEELSGLCELCIKEAAEIECASCGPVRVNSTDGGPLLLCAECSSGLHSKGVFTFHKLVKISRKLWLPVEEKLDQLKQQEAMLNDRRTKILETMKRINDNYDEAVEQLEITMKELQDAFVDKKQMLISNLTDVRNQQLLNCEHIDVTCTALVDHVTQITSKANECLALEARQFAEQKATLLDEMSTVLEQSIPPILPVTDITFSLADSVAMLKHQINDLLILPLLGKRVRAGEHVQGTVVNKLTFQGLFWLRMVRRESEGALMVISQSIRADIQRDIIKPVTKATVGQLCCACFSDDNQWHRARVVAMVSTTHVKICYVDYGNYEECPVTHLRSLPDKYLFYPFQTIKCCITNDDGIEFSREARWLFNDRTKNRMIHLHIISELTSSSTDDEIHYLVTVKEPGESGADISSLVLSKMKEEQKQPKHPIIHRDYRLTQQHKLVAATPTPAEAPPIRPSSRLNTDAAEFVLDKQSSSQQQQRGVLQVSQSVFHNMVGVTVTSNVLASEVEKNVTAAVKNNVTATPKGKRGRATTSAPIADTVTTTPTVGVTTTPSGVNNDCVTSITVDNVTTTSTTMGNNVTTTSTGTMDSVTTTSTGTMDSVTTTYTRMGDNVATTPTGVVDNVTITPTGMVDNVTTTTGMVDKVTTIPTCMVDSVTTTPMGNSDTTTSGGMKENANTTTVTVTATSDNVITTPNGVGDIVTIDTPADDAVANEVKVNTINDDSVTTTGMGEGNDKGEDDTTESVGVQQLENLPTDNEALSCNGDGNGCHGSHDCSDSKDNGHDLELVSTGNATPSTEDVSSHDPEMGVTSIYEIDNVAPPPNEALVAGATIEISVVSDLQSDGRFWSQLVADEETDEIFCELMESLQSICAELHSSQKSPKDTSQGTPLVGSFCAALFSADSIWYRASVEQVTGHKLLVRYMDYGNAEMVSCDNIVPLVPKMKELPFQAFLCTMSSSEHSNFTPLMCERFSSLVKNNDVFQAKVLSVKGGVVEVELTVELNDQVINVNEDVYLSDFVSTESLLFTQPPTDTKLTWTEQMEALDSPVTPTNDFPFQLATSNPQQPLPKEQSKSREKSKSHKGSPVCSVRKISNSSSRRMLRRQYSNEKPSGNKKHDKTTAVSNEDTSVVPSSENWESEEESLVGGANGSKDDSQMLFIKGLPPAINMEAIKELFSKHGNVKDVKFDRSYPGRAWITMDVKGAKNAALQLRNHLLSGGDPRGLLINETDNYHSKPRYKGQYKKY